MIEIGCESNRLHGRRTQVTIVITPPPVPCTDPSNTLPGVYPFPWCINIYGLSQIRDLYKTRSRRIFNLMHPMLTKYYLIKIFDHAQLIGPIWLNIALLYKFAFDNLCFAWTMLKTNWLICLIRVTSHLHCNGSIERARTVVDWYDKRSSFVAGMTYRPAT